MQHFCLWNASALCYCEWELSGIYIANLLSLCCQLTHCIHHISRHELLMANMHSIIHLLLALWNLTYYSCSNRSIILKSHFSISRIWDIGAPIISSLPKEHVTSAAITPHFKIGFQDVSNGRPTGSLASSSPIQFPQMVYQTGLLASLGPGISGMRWHNKANTNKYNSTKIWTELGAKHQKYAFTPPWHWLSNFWL